MDYEFNGQAVAWVDDPGSNVRIRFFQGFSVSLDGTDELPAVGIKIENTTTGDYDNLILDGPTAMKMITALVRATTHVTREFLEENK